LNCGFSRIATNARRERALVDIGESLIRIPREQQNIALSLMIPLRMEMPRTR
jgi:hypothetical protein